MRIPPGLEKFLAFLGLHPTRLKWKYYAWRRSRAAAQAAAGQRQHVRLYKTCRYCGHLALAEDPRCQCGKKLPSYTMYRIGRLLALDRPDVTVVSSGFILTIVALFALMVLIAGPRALIRPSIEDTYSFGLFAGVLLRHGHWWRIFSMALCHGGIVHVLFNVMAISQLLPPFEFLIGRWRTLLVITLTQLGAVVAHLAWYDPRTPTVGASGVAFGLIGFGLAYAHRVRNPVIRDRFLHWFIYGVIFGVFVGANNAAHVGGFGTGLPLGYWMAGRQPRAALKAALRVAGMICLAVWAVTLVFLLNSIRQEVQRKWFTKPDREPGVSMGFVSPPAAGKVVSPLQIALRWIPTSLEEASGILVLSASNEGGPGRLRIEWTTTLPDIRNLLPVLADEFLVRDQPREWTIPWRIPADVSGRISVRAFLRNPAGGEISTGAWIDLGSFPRFVEQESEYETILGPQGDRRRAYRDSAPGVEPRAISGVSLVAGRISYVDKLYDRSLQGAGYVGTATRPARYVRMELRRSSDGVLLGAASTNEAGEYAFEMIPSGTIEADLTILARSDASPWTRVQVKALDGDLQAVSAGPFSIDTNRALRLDYTVPTHRGGTRLGGLFNIVDCILTGAEWVSGRTGASVPSLEVYWQDGSTIWSSYSPGSNRIYLLGGTAGDPDHGDDDSYDDSVILHEYGHYMADLYSLDRSPGGEHQLTGYYTPPKAWSEGWASAFQCFVRNSSLYWDARDGDAEGFNIDYETATRNGERLPRLRTMRNEGAITCVLWDLYDDAASSDSTPGEDDDGVSYPAEWIWSVFEQDFRTGMFATLDDFYEGWRNRYPGDPVDEVFAAFHMEMTPSAPDEQVVSRMGLDLAIPDTGVPLRNSLQVSAASGRIPAASEVRCLVAIRHSNRSDLSIRLRHPDGTSVLLKASRPGRYDTRDVFEWYGYPGYEIPVESVDRFAGKSPAGQWMLEVSDDSSFYTGTLLGWRLRIHQAEPVVFLVY